MLVLNSCKTLPKDNDLYFPSAPSPYDDKGNQVVFYDEDTKTVSMSYQFWLQLVDYITEVEEVKKVYELTKDKQ